MVKISCPIKEYVKQKLSFNAHELLKFSFLVALSSIFIDAVVAHGLFWENDPYWTYWITKTFLIATVFSVGTAFLGVGIIPGAIITAVHTLILEVYYQWFAPVGLPQEPEWLDFNKLWTTGVPVHYLSIFAAIFLLCGYGIEAIMIRILHLKECIKKLVNSLQFRAQGTLLYLAC